MDQSGQPVGRLGSCFITLERWNKTENRSGLLARGLPDAVRLDRSGRFRLEGLVPGVKYQLNAVGPNEQPIWQIDGLTTTPGETKDLGDVKPHPF